MILKVKNLTEHIQEIVLLINTKIFYGHWKKYIYFEK